MSKYSPFSKYLESLTVDSITITFTQIEEIIGQQLPPSARTHSVWWSNSQKPGAHNWAYLWLKAGWAKRDVDLDESWVKFERLKTSELLKHYGIESLEAREGYARDQTILVRSRNANLAEERKLLDNFACQACGFLLAIEGRHVIEVHHKNPLSIVGETVTKVDDLVSLCPTCHRIAHLRSVPYTVDEIRALRSNP